MNQSEHMELTLYIPVNYKSHRSLEAKIIGVLNPVTFLAERPTMPRNYTVGDKRFRAFDDPRIDFETRLTCEEESQLQAFVEAVAKRIFAECYPESDQQ